MTTGDSGDDNESTPQEDIPFQQEMERIGARVPPGRMGNAKDLASVSQNRTIYEAALSVLPNSAIVSSRSCCQRICVGSDIHRGRWDHPERRR